VLENTRQQCDRTAGQALVNGHTASGVKPSQVHEGFTHWVCEMLSDPGSRNKPHIRHAIDHMYADVYALDAINW